MWKALPYNIDTYSVPAMYPPIEARLFGRGRGPLLGAMEGLVALWETSGSPRARRKGPQRAVAAPLTALRSTSGLRPSR